MFHITAAGVAWFLAGALLFTVFMYGLAESVASRVHKEEDYVGATPVLAILPFFFAGALFPISAMPGVAGGHREGDAADARARAASLRLHRSDGQGPARHLGDGQRHTEAWLSLGVVALFAVALTAISIRVFSRSAVS